MAYVDNFYKGQFTPLSPEYGHSVKTQMALASLSSTTDGRTANQIKAVTEQLNAGIKSFEVSAGTPAVLEAIPHEQFKEINRLAKLTGSTPTMHGPMIDPTGITDRGWEQEQQTHAERQIWSALERSHELNPNGNTNFTIHASSVGLPSEFIEKQNGEFVKKGVVLIDQSGKSIQVLKDEKHNFPTEKQPTVGPKVFNVEEAIKERNDEIWHQNLSNIAYELNLGMERIGHDPESIERLKKLKELKESKDIPPEEKEMLEKLQLPREGQAELGQVFLKRSYDQVKQFWELAWKATEEDPEKQKKQADLKGFAEDIAPFIANWKKLKDDPSELQNFAKKLDKGVKIMQDLDPQIYRPIKQFAIDKSSETVSNLALKAFDKFGSTAPIITLENHPAQQSLLTSGEDLAATIIEARNKFVNMAIKSKDKGGFDLSKEDAKKEATKLIGATWDVGHANMFKKYGYEDKDILAQTKAVAPFVKHVHLSDNFGYEHTELPMGMGNVPMAEIMQILDKAQKGSKGFEGKKVIEAFQWWEHFAGKGAGNPIIPTLQAFNSPVYGVSNSPYWSGVSGAQGAYMSSPIAYLPEKHFQTYGTGFSSLPQELGGQMPQTNSRFTGTPNA